jgi:riboflavin synthase
VPFCLESHSFETPSAPPQQTHITYFQSAAFVLLESVWSIPMFTGIVETTGIIGHAEQREGCLHLTIKPKIAFSDLHMGDSVAINGVCLTVTAFTPTTFKATVVPETLRLTNLGELVNGSKVNLERSMQANARIGGHYVQGHVDGMGEILELQPDGGTAWLVKISIPTTLEKYVVNKGYIGLDGMSITVIESTSNWFTVTLIPHTREVTIVSQYKIGTRINIEVDMLGKYVEKLLSSSISRITD